MATVGRIGQRFDVAERPLASPDLALDAWTAEVDAPGDVETT